MRPHQYQARQFLAGSVLLEALFGLLIFSMGILALVGMQATAVKQVSSGQYRVEASFLANDLLAQMWLGSRTPSSMASQYASPSGAAYLSWLDAVNAVLPGAVTHPPSVTVNTISGVQSPHVEVMVTLRWQAPGEAVHQYVLVEQIQ